jgi:hypothetical protein
LIERRLEEARAYKLATWRDGQFELTRMGRAIVGCTEVVERMLGCAR